MTMNPFIQQEVRKIESLKIPHMATIRECSQKTGMSYDHIRKLCLAGKIIYIKAGNKYLINMDRFIEFLNTGEEIGGEPSSNKEYHIRVDARPKYIAEDAYFLNPGKKKIVPILCRTGTIVQTCCFCW